jgi:hypothetical protein
VLTVVVAASGSVNLDQAHRNFDSALVKLVAPYYGDAAQESAARELAETLPAISCGGDVSDVESLRETPLHSFLNRVLDAAEEPDGADADKELRALRVDTAVAALHAAHQGNTHGACSSLAYSAGVELRDASGPLMTELARRGVTPAKWNSDRYVVYVNSVSK